MSLWTPCLELRALICFQIALASLWCNIEPKSRSPCWDRVFKRSKRKLLSRKLLETAMWAGKHVSKRGNHRNGAQLQSNMNVSLLEVPFSGWTTGKP